MGRAAAAADAAGIARLPFLLEVGSDDLPARFQPLAIAHLTAAVGRLLDELGLPHAGLRVLAAPRRLAVLVEGLAVRQTDRTLEVKGPPLAAARDAAGAPTPAALGFARKNGVELADCFPLEEAKGTFLAARRLLPGRATADLLAGALPSLVLGIPFPKTMRWGDGDLQWARPLQWVVALLGDAVVPLQLGDLTAGRESRGHRTLDEDRRFAIPAASAYLETARAHGVVVDQDERRRSIGAGFDAAVATIPDARWVPHAELLEEVVFLSEHPTALLGGYEARFFALPTEVIVTALRAHQRYFAVAGADGGLIPYFLTVRDGGDRALDMVRRGNERVLRARLADALFYWEFDQRRSPAEQAARLGSVTWLEGYGTVLDKTRRLEALSARLWELGLGDGTDVPAALTRAATLCKSDLVSEMIRDGKEFTRLEGLIGAHYARRAGEPEEVCRAIERHYLPRGAGEELPGDRISSVLAAADRLDTLAGCWLAGFVPTGARDPYGLRRQALALLRIVLDLDARVRLPLLIGEALAPFAATAGADRIAAAATEVREFVLVRLAGQLEALGCAAETVRAVLPAHGDDPAEALAWARALAGFRDRPDFQLLATGFKRCKNILEGRFLAAEELAGCRSRWLRGGGTPDGEDFARLPDPAEQALRTTVAAAAPALETARETGDYDAALRLLSGLGPAIDRFFEAVRVNVEDEELRRLRHGFLREIHGLFARYADFSEVAPADA
ncbi:MAG: glycine--tRNA ligase subunit beta [Candidatus Krumholzibacteriia bacterium]